MRLVRGRWPVVGIVGALLALTACSHDRSGEEPDAGPSSPAQLPVEDPPVSEPPPSCEDAERRTARELGIWQVSVPHQPGAGSEVAREALTRLVARATAKLRVKCGEVPAGAAAFSETVQEPLTADVFGQKAYVQVLEAWVAWGEAVGAPRTPRSYVDDVRRCTTTVYPAVDATYDLTSTTTATGRAWTLEVTFDNRTGSVLDGSMSGEIAGKAVLPDPFGTARGPKPGEGRALRLHWGGSSADFLELQPGTTTQTVAPDIDTDVHTTADGRLRVVEFTADLAIRGQRGSCTLVAQPAG